jgi:DNA polymerase III epsilon subunit-like protein
VSPSARAVHGITDAELADAPNAADVLPRFLAWLKEHEATTLLAHNASFDAAFLGSTLERLNLLDGQEIEIVDTLPLSRKKLPAVPNHRLDTLAIWLDLDRTGTHRALTDATRVKGLWLTLTQGHAPPNRISYPVQPQTGEPPVPSGWLRFADAFGRRVRITYEGGTKGLAPREITPRRFQHMGGVAYVVAECHASAIEKTFRLDRVVTWEVV